MDTYWKKYAFSAPRRNPFHHVYVKITQHDYRHTLRETAADNREARVTLRNYKHSRPNADLFCFQFMVRRILKVKRGRTIALHY